LWRDTCSIISSTTPSSFSTTTSSSFSSTSSSFSLYTHIPTTNYHHHLFQPNIDRFKYLFHLEKAENEISESPPNETKDKEKDDDEEYGNHAGVKHQNRRTTSWQRHKVGI